MLLCYNKKEFKKNEKLLHIFYPVIIFSLLAALQAGVWCPVAPIAENRYYILKIKPESKFNK